MASSTTTALPSSFAFQPRRHLASRMAEWPWWVLFILLGALFLIYNFVTNATYKEVLSVLAEGVKLTVTITIIAYAFAVALGLLTALGQLSRNTLIHNVATLYVQIIRGVPILVQIFYTAFVIVPAAIASLNALGAWLVQAGWLGPSNPFVVLSVRDVDFLARGIIALAISYGAFSSEIFRAGIQSIERGQVEAGQALGLRRIQSLRLVILPQAIRRVLPPLGNDFIAMLKESSLVSVLGVGEITQLGKKFAAASFLYPETYNTAAFLYLSMTLVLSMGVRLMERRLKTRA